MGSLCSWRIQRKGAHLGGQKAKRSSSFSPKTFSSGACSPTISVAMFLAISSVISLLAFYYLLPVHQVLVTPGLPQLTVWDGSQSDQQSHTEHAVSWSTWLPPCGSGTGNLGTGCAKCDQPACFGSHPETPGLVQRGLLRAAWAQGLDAIQGREHEVSLGFPSSRWQQFPRLSGMVGHHWKGPTDFFFAIFRGLYIKDLICFTVLAWFYGSMRMKMHKSRRKQHLWTELDLPAVTRICFTSTDFSPFSYPHHFVNTKYAVWEKDQSFAWKTAKDFAADITVVQKLAQHSPHLQDAIRRARPLEEAPSDEEALATHHCPIPLGQKPNSTGKESFYFGSSFKWHCESHRVKGSFMLTLQGTNQKLLHDVFYNTKVQKSTMG